MKHTVPVILLAAALAAGPAAADLSGTPLRVLPQTDGSLVIVLSIEQASDCEQGGGCKLISQADLLRLLQVVAQEAAQAAGAAAQKTCGRLAS